MTKGKKKTNRRLKRTVRKTLGTLFLISAIVVAAIPTEGLRAEEDAVAQAAGHTHDTTHSGRYTYFRQCKIQGIHPERCVGEGSGSEGWKQCPDYGFIDSCSSFGNNDLYHQYEC